MTAGVAGRTEVTPSAPTRISVGLPIAAGTLARQKLLTALRSGDLFFAFFSPIAFFVCFYVPLHRRFELSGMDYAQFLTPIIILQSAIFTAIAATEMAGADAREGLRERLASLPIARTAPMLGRLAWVMVRLAAALCGALLIGFALGFRFHASLWDSACFVIMAALFGMTLSMITDAVGTVVGNAASVAQLLMIPQLILVMASTGLVPAQAFPGWAQPFVRNQPLSVFADAMRGLAQGTHPDLTAALLWTVGLLIAGGVAIRWAGRAQVRR